MNSLEKYFLLLKKKPELFKNSGDVGEIKIITDKKRILAEQKKICAKLKKEGKPLCWIDIGVLAEDQWFYVLRDMVEFPDGRMGGYIRWINRKSMTVVTEVIYFSLGIRSPFISSSERLCKMGI